MKKHFICFMLGLTVAFCANAFANESYTNNSPEVSMPSDAEIMKTIRKFNFNKTQQDYLFKETKRKLEEMYSKQDFSPILEGETTLIDDSPSTIEQVSKQKKYIK